MSRARSQNKACGCAPLPCSAQGDLRLSPPGPLGEGGRSFTLTWPGFLTWGPGREMRFPTGWFSRMPVPGQGTRIQKHRGPVHRWKDSPLFPSLSHHPFRPSAIAPHIHAESHDSIPKVRADSHTGDTCTYTHPAPATGCHTPTVHPKSHRPAGHQAHHFHFCSSAPRRPEAPGPPATASLLLKPLGDLELPGSTQGKPLSSETACVRWFCKPGQH